MNVSLLQVMMDREEMTPENLRDTAKVLYKEHKM
jgi:hypothetical protein